jgi:hypothetical protein
MLLIFFSGKIKFELCESLHDVTRLTLQVKKQSIQSVKT